MKVPGPPQDSSNVKVPNSTSFTNDAAAFQSTAALPTNDSNTNPNGNQETKQSFYKIIYFIIRYFIVLIALFLSLIAAIYGLSALITTQATNFFCPFYTASEVHEYNRKHNLNEGDRSSCWYIERPQVDDDKIKNLKLDIYEANVDNQSFITIFACLVFSSLSLLLLFIGLQNGYFVIYDTLHSFAFNSPNPRVVKVIEYYEDEDRVKRSSLTIKMAERKNKSFLYQCSIWSEYIYDQYCWIYEKYLYFDSKYKVLVAFFWEIIEIIVQFYGLCLYGGYDLFEPNTVVLAQKYYIVESFSIILGLNCVCTGISWIVYIVWHETWYVCRVYVV